MNETEIENYTKVFAALSNTIRLNIVLGILKNGRCNVNSMTQRLGISQALVSQHVKILKEAHIIEGTRDGNIIWYKICSDRTMQILNAISNDLLNEKN